LNDYSPHFPEYAGEKDDVVDTNWLC